MLREFKSIWNDLSNPSTFTQRLVDRSNGYQLEFINDPLEIFSDSNSRPISIEIEIEEESNSATIIANKLVISASRNAPTTWTIDIHSEKEGLLSAAQNRMQKAGEMIQIQIKDTMYAVSIATLSATCALFFRSLYIGPFRTQSTSALQVITTFKLERVLSCVEQLENRANQVSESSHQ